MGARPSVEAREISFTTCVWIPVCEPNGGRAWNEKKVSAISDVIILFPPPPPLQKVEISYHIACWAFSMDESWEMLLTN